MNTIRLKSETRARIRNLGATLLGAAIGFATTASALAADTVTLRVGDQKGGNRSLLEIAGLARDLPYKIEWSEFPAAAPILEALNAGALDVGYTGDLAFLQNTIERRLAAGAACFARPPLDFDRFLSWPMSALRQEPPFRSLTNLNINRRAPLFDYEAALSASLNLAELSGTQ